MESMLTYSHKTYRAAHWGKRGLNFIKVESTTEIKVICHYCNSLCDGRLRLRYLKDAIGMCRGSQEIIGNVGVKPAVQRGQIISDVLWPMNTDNPDHSSRDQSLQPDKPGPSRQGWCWTCQSNCYVRAMTILPLPLHFPAMLHCEKNLSHWK